MTPQPLRSFHQGEDADPAGGERFAQPERQLRLFVSLPAYAENERGRVLARLADLNHAFSGVLSIAASGPGISEAAPESVLGAAECDAVIAVLRPRLPDDPEIVEQAGTRGGAAALVSAMGSGGAAGLPDIHIFRYAESPEQAAADTDWQSGKRAFEAWFRARGGQELSFDDFSSPAGFDEQLEARLSAWLTGLGFEPRPIAELVAFEPAIAEPPLPEPYGAEPEALPAAAELAREIEALSTTDPVEAEEPPAIAEPAVAETMPEIEPAPAAEIFKTIPAHEESSEVVRRDRYRRLTNFLYRRQATYTPPGEAESDAADEDDGALIVGGEVADLSAGDFEMSAPAAFLDDLEIPPETVLEDFAEARPEDFIEDDSALIVESSLVEPVAFLEEMESVPETVAATPPENPEPIEEDLPAEDEGALLVEAELVAAGEAAEAVDTVVVADAPEMLVEAEPAEPEAALAMPEDVAQAPLAMLSEPDLKEPAPLVSWEEHAAPNVVPLRPEYEPVVETISVTRMRSPRAAMLGMTALTAASLAFAGFAGLMWMGARSAAGRADERLAAATQSAGNLVFSLTEEARRVGGAINESSNAIMGAAQKLHGMLLSNGAIVPDALLKQANRKLDEAKEFNKQNKLPEALSAAVEGQKLFQTLVDFDPTRAEWQKQLAVSHRSIGDVLLAQKNLIEAVGAYGDDIAIRKMLSAKDPDSVEKRAELSIAEIKAADVLAFRGRLDDALSTYRDALAIRKTLAQRDANNADRQRDLMEIDNKVADVLAAQNHLDDALSSYRDALAITTKMAVMNPADPRWRNASAQTDDKIGDVLVGKGRFDDGLASYRDGLAIMKDVAANEPSNSEWQGSIAAIHQRIGDAFMAESHFESGLSSYRDELAVIQAVLAKDPKSVSWRHAASDAQIRVGQALFSQNNLDGALAAHRESQSIMKALVAEDPGNSRFQHDLMMSDNDIGILLNQKGVRAEALAAYRDAQQIATAMGAKEPNNSDWPVTRAMIDNNLGALQMDVGNRDDGVAAYRDGLEVSKGLVARDPRNAEWQAALAVSLYNLGEAGVDSEANFVQARDLLVRLENAGALRPDKKALIPHVDDALEKLRGKHR